MRFVHNSFYGWYPDGTAPGSVDGLSRQRPPIPSQDRPTASMSQALGVSQSGRVTSAAHVTAEICTATKVPSPSFRAART